MSWHTHIYFQNESLQMENIAYRDWILGGCECHGEWVIHWRQKIKQKKSFEWIMKSNVNFKCATHIHIIFIAQVRISKSPTFHPNIFPENYCEFRPFQTKLTFVHFGPYNRLQWNEISQNIDSKSTKFKLYTPCLRCLFGSHFSALIF